MRSLFVCLLIAACDPIPPKPVAPSCPPPPPPPPPPAVPAVVAPTPPDDAVVLAKSHDLLAAIDHDDRAALDALVDPGFVAGGTRTYNLEIIRHGMQTDLDHHLPARSRTCKGERVVRGEHSIVYAGVCEVTYPAHDDMPMLAHPYYVNLVWAPSASDWRAVYYTKNDAGQEAERESWNETFRTAVFFKTTANQHLIDAVKGKKPGTALDVNMGQGRNALYLASQGWKTTGIDISDEGIKIAQANAARQKLKLETIVTDNMAYDFGKAKWDLVTLIYAGSNHALIEKIQPSIKKGGLFVVEFFARDATKGTGIGGFEPGELAALFKDGWKIVTDEVVEDIADWGLSKTKVVRFTAQKL